jgi:PIN domain nuclease of toxin-antitoxin system
MKPTLKAIHISSRASQSITKTEKEYVLPVHTYELNNKHRKTKLNVESTMHNNVYKT